MEKDFKLPKGFIIYLEERNIKDLLQVMLDNIHYLELGLCHLSFKLKNLKKINHDEFSLLKQFFYENKPNHINIKHYWDRHWFEKGKIEPRIKWLKEQIEKLENGYG